MFSVHFSGMPVFRQLDCVGVERDRIPGHNAESSTATEFEQAMPLMVVAV